MEKLIDKEHFGKPLSSEELKKLKEVEYSILNDFILMAKKEKIDYFLFAGTLLGSIRHNGFIPWDDDIDLSVRIEDIYRIPSLMNKYFPNKYFFCGGFYNESDPFAGLKIMLKGTKLIEEVTKDYPITRGIDIDIFPLSSAPNTIHKRNKLEKKIKFLNFVCSCVYDREVKNNFILGSKNKKIRRYFRFRRFASYFFPLKFNKYCKIRNNLLMKKYKSEYCCIVYVGLNSNSMKFCDIFPLSEHVFETDNFSIPLNHDAVLSCSYGKDYMVETPPEKRVVRPFYLIDFGE